MLNPNDQPILSTDEKINAFDDGRYRIPLTVAAYDEMSDTFIITGDRRYEELGQDTDYVEIDDFTLPACVIFQLIGEVVDYQNLDELVGICFLAEGT